MLRIMKRTYLPLKSAEIDTLPANLVHATWRGSDGVLNASCFYCKGSGLQVSSLVRPDFLIPRSIKGFLKELKK
jgi:hypothetical protein